MPGPGKDPIFLFAGGDDGYGDAINVGRNAYHWANGWDCRGGSGAAVAPAPTSIGNLWFQREIVAAFEWENSSGIPILLFAAGGAGSKKRSGRLQDGTEFLEQNVSASPFTGGVLYRHDGSDPDVEMAYFCNGSGNDVILQRNKAGAYADAGHDAKADLMAVIGSDLWITQGYKIAKCTLNADPGLAASYPTFIPVGRPTYAINAVVPLGGSPIVCKGDGVFKYNPAPSVAEFENLTPFITPHPNNGKGAMTDGRGRVYYPTADGQVLVIEPGYMSQQTPLRTRSFSRDTPFGRIRAFAADAEHVYAATIPGHVQTTGDAAKTNLGMIVKKYESSSYTDYTTEVTDNKRSTVADFSDVDGGAGEYIYIGANEPFWGIGAQLDTVEPTGGLLCFYSDGAAGWPSLTIKKSVGSWSRDGIIAFLPSTDIYQDGLTGSGWKKETVDGDSKYWMRIAHGDALTGLKVWRIGLCPYRPPLLADVFPVTGQILAGVLPHILVGTWRGEEIVWHHLWTLETSQVDQLVVNRTTAANAGDERTLWALSLDDYYYMPLGPESHPLRASWPVTSGGAPTIAFSGNHFGMPQNVKRVEGKVVIDMKYVQSNDEVWFVYWWDEDTDRVYHHGPLAQDELVLDGLEGQGRVLYSALMWKDGSRDAIAPQLLGVYIPEGQWEDLGPAHIVQTDITSPLSR